MVAVLGSRTRYRQVMSLEWFIVVRATPPQCHIILYNKFLPTIPNYIKFFFRMPVVFVSKSSHALVIILLIKSISTGMAVTFPVASITSFRPIIPSATFPAITTVMS